MGITTSPIVVHLDSIGVDDYLASDDQAKTVLHALEAYGYLLKQPPRGALRRYSFADLASVIEMHYDVTDARHREVVAVLREVHRLNSGESPVRSKVKSIVLTREITAYAAVLEAFAQKHEAELAALVQAVNAGRITLDEDEHWSRVDLMKGVLGSQCANAVGSREDDQEEALVLAETWVSANYSQFEPRTSLLLAFWLEGVEAVSSKLRSAAEAHHE